MLALWVLVLVVGVAASLRLQPLLSNVFTVPGTDSDRARIVLQRHFGQRPDGVFTVVFAAHSGDRALVGRKLALAARQVPNGHASRIRDAGGVLWGEVDTPLDLQHAKGYTDTLRRALTGRPRAYVTGSPAIQHDLEPILASDLRRGEAFALPIALVILLAVLGVSLAVLVPFAFAACTISASLAVVYALAHAFTMVSYVSNLVVLVGIALAIDYSLLIVYRFREELRRQASVDDAIVCTMETAGRSVVFSGGTVAIGLGLLLLVPVPFMRSLGVGGLVVPLASIVAALSLQPVLLSLLGRRGIRRATVAQALRTRFGLPVPRSPGGGDIDRGYWARLARTIMRRPVPFLVVGTAVLLVCAAPALFLRITPGSILALPRGPESVTGLQLLRDNVGPGALTPIQIVVDSGRADGTRTRALRSAVGRLTNETFHDSEAYITASGPDPPYVDRSRRYRLIYVVARHEYGDGRTQALVRRIRATMIPRARFPSTAAVHVGGGPAQGVDYLSRTYAWFPWLVAGALALTYVLLLRAFRSVVLPLKAVVLNLLTVAAAYGLLVVAFQWGVGADALGLHHVSQIEAWVPVFLFAMLFGLSMDYEVFIVTRMRESWDHVHDNRRAVAHGLERTGRIVTAAALIMIVAFSGFVAGRVAGLQELGLGLALAILLDATVVRTILVPSLMAIFGRWNWWLPRGGSSRPLPSSTRST